ncbi:SpaH/EbpB family LPXTG-anchored major pilin [Clostridium sp. Marseille-P3244]|uniref:SpaH/EbpB family LPXTG-anchored major pilin n=1 Tax=Clostridium sp. Marseille-P3244 TaxID=1871020 RepID=UPI000931EBEF|nr:SpaH/EbpB family LPXTG-anchored major pilin [Clostridium sp. Marseille-P3244]
MKKSRTTRWAAKALALCLAGAAVFGCGSLLAPVKAEAAPTIEATPTTGSITINKKAETADTPLAGATFTIYQVMSLTPGANAGNYAEYEPAAGFESVLAGVDPDDLGNYSATQLEGLIDQLVTAAEAADPVDSQTTNDSGTATFSGLDLGYYLVIETAAPETYVAGSPFLIAVPSTNNYNNGSAQGTEWVYDVVAEPKNAKISIDKELAGEEEGAEQDGTITVGDFVKYQVTTTIPEYPEEYFDSDVTFTITDVMDDGLEIQDDGTHPVTVTVDGGAVTAGADTYTKTASDVTGSGADLTIAFVKDYIQDNMGKDVVITYYAQVTENAISGTTGNGNQVTLTYNNNPGSTTTAQPPKVNVYSFNFKVEKFTTDGGQKALEGAEFELYSDEDLQHQVGTAQTSNASGELSFEKLDEGTYWLVETKSPAGYTLLADPIKVGIEATTGGNFNLTVNDEPISSGGSTFTTRLEASTGTAIIAVENHEGFTLPATGGMGIALFVIVGIAGIITVSVVITKRTKKNN